MTAASSSGQQLRFSSHMENLAHGDWKKKLQPIRGREPGLETKRVPLNRPSFLSTGRLVFNNAHGLGFPAWVANCSAKHNGEPVVDVESEPSSSTEKLESGKKDESDKSDPSSRKPLPRRRPPWLLWLLVRAVHFVVTGLQRLLSQWWGQVLAFFVIGSLSGRVILALVKPTGEMLYSDFVSLVESGVVQSAQFEHNSDRIYFTIRPEFLSQNDNQISIKPNEQAKAKGRAAKPKPSAVDPATPANAESLQALERKQNFRLMVRSMPGQSNVLHDLMRKNKVRFGVVGSSLRSSLTRLAGTLAFLWIPLLPLFWLFRRTLGSQGNKKAKKAGSSTPPVMFSDVAGMESAKVELMEVVTLLKDPNKFAKLSAKVPSGVLLCGPTGTGKTLLARAVAGEAGVPFFTASASEFVEMFVGRGAARIRDLFKEARKSTPCVVFIDEIDSVGGRRGYSLNDERDQTLNQLLVELDGFEGNQGIVLLAATNRPEILDSALLRPGRLTRKIKVSLPDEAARSAILQVHLRDVPMESTAEKIRAAGYIAKLTNGFSGAELANCANEAALLAARDSREVVVFTDLVRGVERTREPLMSGSTSGGMMSGLVNWMSQNEMVPRPRAGA
ncbi:hypothetical protein BSKO_10893 [Bryopsis sp. KO-2023]|nr:hypothetical protein BSKO_10893 [Bryopsis sp. KO-2023]